MMQSSGFVEITYLDWGFNPLLVTGSLHHQRPPSPARGQLSVCDECAQSFIRYQKNECFITWNLAGLQPSTERIRLWDDAAPQLCHFPVWIWEIKSQRCAGSQHYANLSVFMPRRSLNWITQMQMSSTETEIAVCLVFFFFLFVCFCECNPASNSCNCQQGRHLLPHELEPALSLEGHQV